MDTSKPDSASPNDDAVVVHGSGSVAHQIIGEFLSALVDSEGFDEIAMNLKAAIFNGKPTEAALRTAMFGEEPL
jgi:isopentenyl phosphate kinase